MLVSSLPLVDDSNWYLYAMSPLFNVGLGLWLDFALELGLGLKLVGIARHGNEHCIHVLFSSILD